MSLISEKVPSCYTAPGGQEETCSLLYALKFSVSILLYMNIARKLHISFNFIIYLQFSHSVVSNSL